MVSERERKKKGADGISEWVTGNKGKGGREEGRERKKKGGREEGREGEGESPCSFTALTSQSIRTIVVHT